MHKKIRLIKRITHEVKQHDKIVIGVVGTHSGIGVTHICLMLAHYFNRWAGMNTAYIECFPQNQIRQLREYDIGKTNELYQEEQRFIAQGITYFNQAKASSITDSYNDNFGCIILDMGSDYYKNKSEFLRCNKKIVMTTLSPWKMEGLEKFLLHTHHMKSNNQWTYLVPNGQQDCKIAKFKQIPGKLYEVPYEPDPFHLHWETINFLNKIIL